MQGTRTVEDPKTGIRILISRPAQLRIGQKNIDAVLKTLRDFLEAMGAQGAYVSKSGAGLEISIIGTPFKIAPWRLQP